MIILSFGSKTLPSPLQGGSEIIFWPFLKNPKIHILAPRPLKKSSNQNVIKIKVLHIDEIYLNPYNPMSSKMYFNFKTIPRAIFFVIFFSVHLVILCLQVILASEFYFDPLWLGLWVKYVNNLYDVSPKNSSCTVVQRKVSFVSHIPS